MNLAQLRNAAENKVKGKQNGYIVTDDGNGLAESDEYQDDDEGLNLAETEDMARALIREAENTDIDSRVVEAIQKVLAEEGYSLAQSGNKEKFFWLIPRLISGLTSLFHKR